MENILSENDFLTIVEASQYLDISQKAVRRYIASGELAAEKIEGAYKIKKSIIETFTRSNLVSQIDNISYDLFGEPILPTKNTIVAKNNPKIRKIDTIDWVDITGNWENISPSSLTFVDLFSGAGGITKGFELAGLQGICGLDWFEAAGKTYRRNFKHSFIEGDIKTTEKKDEFYEAVKKGLNGRSLNIVAGGFPCQGFSLAGNRIVDDPRNNLYQELLTIVQHLKPEFVVCENVVGLRSMLKGEVEKMILNDFTAAGYSMSVTVLRAADYAVPQKRDRVIFIGNRINKPNFYPRPLLSPNEYITTGEAIADLMEYPENIAFNHVPTKHKPEMIAKMLALEEGKSLYEGYSDAWKKCAWGEPSCTIKENHGGVNVHPRLGRVLTAREMARLQSFPDDFIFEGAKNKQLVQLGNAVPPLLAKAIGLGIRKAYTEI